MVYLAVHGISSHLFCHCTVGTMVHVNQVAFRLYWLGTAIKGSLFLTRNGISFNLSFTV